MNSTDPNAARANSPDSHTASDAPETRMRAAEVYRARRDHLRAALRAAGGGVAIVPTAPEVTRSRDSEYPYRHDSYFYYLTGFAEPGTWLVLDADAAPPASGARLFCRPKDSECETWDGVRLGPDAAPGWLGVDAAFSNEELDARMPDLLANARALHYAWGRSATLDEQIGRWLRTVRGKARAGARAPEGARDLIPLLDEMRLVKDEHELALMREAGRISASAHRLAMMRCRPGMREYQLEAELLYAFRRQGAQAPAYTSIVAAGANACILHYPAGEAILRAGELVLIDAGCEFGGYAGDITRTFPVDGRCNGARRELYELVLAAQAAAIEATRVGARFDDPHERAVRVLAQGMLDTGLLDRNTVGTLDDVIEKRAFTRFYMHRTGHWLGMDVHDVGDYLDRSAAAASASASEDDRQPGYGHNHANAKVDANGNEPGGSSCGVERPAPPSRLLQAGMTLTVEPGIYVRAAPGVPERYWNIGIRIEDDALVTPDGCALLTRDVPVEMAEIEALMRA